MKILLLLIFISINVLAQNPRLMRQDARELMDQGKYEQAVKLYDLLIYLKPEDYEAHFKRGQAHAYLGNDSLAVKDFTSTISLQPENIHYVYYNRAFSYSDIGDHVSAIKDLDSAIMFKPNYHEAYNNRGLEREKIGDFKNALSDYAHAIKIDSTNWVYYFNIGRIYETTNQDPLAIKFLSIALTAKPDNKEALKLRGSALAKLKEFDKAERDFAAYLVLDNTDADVLLKHGFCLIAMGQKMKACIQLELSKEYGNEKAENLIEQFCKE